MTNDLEYYNKVYADSKEYRKDPMQSRYISVWKNILNIVGREEAIIEIGCGSGQLAKLLLQNKRIYLSGFDYSYQAIDIAKTLNHKHKDLFSVRDVYTIGYGDLRADTIICTEVLEHLDDDIYVIDILESGTRFVFSVPDFWYKTHKRVFKTFEDIKTRYAGLDISGYFKHRTPNGNNIFLVDSTVK